jgi:hypothetical protein
VERAASTEEIGLHADALTAEAEVLTLASLPGAAQQAIDEALDLYARKQDLASARHAREAVLIPS